MSSSTTGSSGTVGSNKFRDCFPLGPKIKHLKNCCLFVSRIYIYIGKLRYLGTFFSAEASAWRFAPRVTVCMTSSLNICSNTGWIWRVHNFWRRPIWQFPSALSSNSTLVETWWYHMSYCSWTKFAVDIPMVSIDIQLPLAGFLSIPRS